MKKSAFYLFIMSCMLSITFISCNKEDSLTNDVVKTKSSNVRWYGKADNASLQDNFSTKGVANKTKLWDQEAGITIKFINNPIGLSVEQIKSIASEWELYAGIKFNFVSATQDAPVRIAFDWKGNDWLTWSYTGTDANLNKNQSQPTAVFGGLQYLNQTQMKGDILRLFGQILGLEYEQRHQNWTFWRDEAKLETYWQQYFVGMNMDWTQIREYVFTPLTGTNAIYPTQTNQIDEKSIMVWPYYTNLQTTNLLANYELSDGDKDFIAQLYPFDNSNLPTIQKAWIDAGYMFWKNSNKTELQLSALGKQQESLPDVSDGQQLRSLEGLFADSKLKRAPKMNTSEVSNFNAMFYNCTSLTSIPNYDTSSGTSFSYTFAGCSSLTTIPNFDLSRGIYFTNMFEKCTSLLKIPALNTFRGLSFNYMFRGCSSLAEIQSINTRDGLSYNAMFYGCKSLKSIPDLPTDKGLDFTKMFAYCSGLQQKPNLVIQVAAKTTDMYQGTKFN